MLVGVLLGVLITVLALLSFWLTAQNRLLKNANAEQAQDLFATRLALGKVAAQEQERKRLNESIVFNLTEEQVTTLAGKISHRVQTILDAQTAEALNKLS